MSTSLIKGIGCVKIASTATGDLPFSLKSDCGTLDRMPPIPAIYVNSNPYNLIPPQLLIVHMKKHGFKIDKFLHDDAEYIFRYTAPSLDNNCRSLTVPINLSDLFHFYSGNGYHNFSTWAKKYQPHWNSYAGDIIPNYDTDGDISLCHSIDSLSNPHPSTCNPFTSDKTRETHDQTRETRTKTREHDTPSPSTLHNPTIIPHSSTDFIPIKTTPIDTPLSTIHHTTIDTDNPNIIATRRKKIDFLLVMKIWSSQFFLIENPCKVCHYTTWIS